MALSLVTSTSLALRPDSQHALAHRPEITPATRDSETAQYKNVLAVAVSQEQRLSRNGAVRRGAGYDMTDPFMVATSEMDFTGKPCKPLEFAKLEVPGLPCQVVGDTTVVAAFLRVVKDKDKPKKPQECVMRFPYQTTATMRLGHGDRFERGTRTLQRLSLHLRPSCSAGTSCILGHV